MGREDATTEQDIGEGKIYIDPPTKVLCIILLEHNVKSCYFSLNSEVSISNHLWMLDARPLYTLILFFFSASSSRPGPGERTLCLREPQWHHDPGPAGWSPVFR